MIVADHADGAAGPSMVQQTSFVQAGSLYDDANMMAGLPMDVATILVSMQQQKKENN